MRILLIAPAMHPPTFGGRQRTQLILRALRLCGHVDLFVVGPMPDADVAQLVREFNLVGRGVAKERGRYGLWLLIRPIRPKLVDRLAHNLGRRRIGYSPDTDVAAAIARIARDRKYDVVVGRYLLPTVQGGAFDLGVPVIVDVDDLETDVYHTRMSAPDVPLWKRLILSNHRRQLYHILPAWFSRAAHLWFTCALDVPHDAQPNVSVLPNIPFFDVDAAPVDSEDGQGHTVLVVGTLAYPPNRTGVEWFLKRVWPAVLAARSNAVLRIVGGGLNERAAARWRAIRNVSVAGYVPVIEAEYRRASVVVAPIFEGGGTKIKVIEALQYARAVVVTTHALRGYAEFLRNDESIVVADNPRQFADSVIALLGDPQRRSALGAAGAASVREHLSFDIFASIVRETLEQVRPRSRRIAALG